VRKLIVLLALVLMVPSTTASWSQENLDPANVGQRAIDAPNSLDDAETTNLDGRVLAQVTEGPASLALAGTLQGTVAAVDANGDVVWEADAGDELRTAPLWTGEVVVAVPKGGQATAFTPTGEEAWTLDIGNDRTQAGGDDIALVRMASPVEYPSGDVVIVDLEGQVHRVTPSGEVVWQTDVGGTDAIEATPVIAPDGDVIVAAFTPNQEGEGRLLKLDADTGKPDCPDCWTRDIGSQVVGAPAITADVVLVPLRDGNALEARSLSDGTQRWERAFDDSIPASPSIHGDLAIVGDIAGNMRAVQVSGGAIEWEFNPLNDDATTGVTGECTALTVADSVAVDGNGVAWTPFWNADICNGFPPQDSGESPFYRLDAETGEPIDDERYTKAAHGPGLHETGVWVGGDEGLVRHFPTQPGLGVHAVTADDTVRVITNTRLSGDWTIETGDQARESGTGQPPHVVEDTLPPGTHDIQVTVDDTTRSVTVTIQGGETRTPSDSEASPEGDDNASSVSESTTEDDSSTEPDNISGSTSDEAPQQAVPLAAWIALVALAVAAGRRRVA